MASTVDFYFTDGCGRCALVSTPACSVNKWQPELRELRALVLGCGLTEELKWGVACYTFQQKNVVLIHAFKEYCALNFFNGALLSDTNGILVRQTENVQAARQIRFNDVREITRLRAVLQAYIREAIEVEKAGVKVSFKPTSEFAVSGELQQALNSSAALNAAFNTLTPGRQRGYLLYFAAPKQAKTRAARIEKYTPQILRGKGLHD